MNIPKFSIDSAILAARIDEADAASAATRVAHERHRDRLQALRDAKADYDAARAEMASRQRYLNQDRESASREKHEAEVAKAKARLDAADVAAKQAGETYQTRQAVSNTALAIANACRDHAARVGIEV